MPSSRIDFRDRVVVVTGAAGGLGAAHAAAFASRGARLLLTDRSEDVEAVAARLKAQGAEAESAVGDVADPAGCQAAITQALAAWGRIDVLVNNAGLLRDRVLEKQTDEEWRRVIAVHLDGARHMTRAAWDPMRERKYGRIVNTTSASGLYGNFGQTNYAAAKMGLVGFTRSCALEGARHGIKANCVAPIAHTPMTDSLWPEDAKTGTAADLVSPVVVWLGSETCAETGVTLACGGGYVSRVAVMEGAGAWASGADELSPEWVAAQWPRIADMDGASEPASVNDALRTVFQGRTGGGGT